MTGNGVRGLRLLASLSRSDDDLALEVLDRARTRAGKPAS